MCRLIIFLAIGSAGGDPFNSNFTVHYPSWSAMERDLLYAYQELTRNIYIYSLPGKHATIIARCLRLLTDPQVLLVKAGYTRLSNWTGASLSRSEIAWRLNFKRLQSLVIAPNCIRFYRHRPFPPKRTRVGLLSTILMPSRTFSSSFFSTWVSALNFFATESVNCVNNVNTAWLSSGNQIKVTGISLHHFHIYSFHSRSSYQKEACIRVWVPSFWQMSSTPNSEYLLHGGN